MKKLIAILMVATMVLSLFALVGCTEKKENLKLGLGVVTSVSATDATDEANGQGKATITAAAVLVDANGKIVKAFIDCADNAVEYTAGGTAVAATAFKTKYELGANYGMTNPAYGGTATKEWFEQAAAFDAACIGKTATEIKALMGADYKGTAELQSAGCTIYVSGLVMAASKIG